MFNKVVWATDGSTAADQALALARKLVEESKGELIAIHCEEIALWGNQAVPVQADAEKFKQKIQGQVAELSNSGVAGTLELTRAGVGGAAQAIGGAAKTLQADVVVVGTRGRNPLAGLLLGSVTQRLLQIAPCPVLVVPSRSDAQDR